MIRKITGSYYLNMIKSGLANLDKHRNKVNDLNVFPVPDGDTGTNMVLTIKNGLDSAIKDVTDSVSKTAKNFANSVVFGARGNSGVIVSQFFKGMSVGFEKYEAADARTLINAMDKGIEYAYASVANPVEGTILTVLKDATEAVKKNADSFESVNEVIDLFIKEAKASLDNTPELLPILKRSGVVDSGGAGIVYFFEGVRKFLEGEEIDESAQPYEAEPLTVDYSRFNENSRFDYGYCTEFLLQLTANKQSFSYDVFVEELKKLGNSIVTSFENDKVKVHVHTSEPERAIAYAHGFGEFLTLKIENMSVMHTEEEPKILLSEESGEGAFAIVAVAPNRMLQRTFAEMGADAVIFSEEAPSSNDFIEAFKLIKCKNILVLPNSSNSILSAMQAGSLYKGAKITVLNCRSIPQCYSALAIVDFSSDDVDSVIRTVNDTVGNIHEISVAKAAKSVKFGNKTIVKNDYIALDGDDITVSGDNFEDVLLSAVKKYAEGLDIGVITLFYGLNLNAEQTDDLAEKIDCLGFDAEILSIPTEDPIIDLTVAFE